jgi:hypothetical protein
MANTIQNQKKRDKKENNLRALEENQRASNESVVRIKYQFETKLKEYQKWKKEENIEGIYY